MSFPKVVSAQRVVSVPKMTSPPEVVSAHRVLGVPKVMSMVSVPKDPLII